MVPTHCNHFSFYYRMFVKSMKVQVAAFWVGLAVLLFRVQAVEAQYNPPRIIQIIHKANPGDLPDSLSDKKSYFIDRGRESNIYRGDVLNVYREKFILGPKMPPIRVLIGTMQIKVSQNGSASGTFFPNHVTMEEPIIRYRTALKGDVVVPRLTLDASVLFSAGRSGLITGAAQELLRVADFVRLFKPTKVVIEGHTDSDGSREYNQKLSEDRSALIRDALIQSFEFITQGMVESIGYGEDRPRVENDTPANKALNRRIDIVIWD